MHRLIQHRLYASQVRCQPDLLGTDAFQETDVIGISMPVTKWNYLVTKAEEIPAIMAQAFYIARSGRPGPVLIDITKNAQFGELDFEYRKCTKIRSYVPKPKIDMEPIQEAAALINKAKKPYVLVGQGVILGEAEKEFLTFIEKSGIPSCLDNSRSLCLAQGTPFECWYAGHAWQLFHKPQDK